MSVSTVVGGFPRTEREKNMQAIFRFNGYDEIRISTQGGGILVQHTINQPANNEKASLHLSKSGARSVASALMQAAAEL